jgi:hypothetical protein
MFQQLDQRDFLGIVEFKGGHRDTLLGEGPSAHC